MNIQDNKAIERLLKKQHEICSDILTELKQCGQKKTHWSWYIFPTNKPGLSDPLQTYITKDTVLWHFTFRIDNLGNWQRIVSCRC